MELQLEIISGTRKGKTIDIVRDIQLDSILPFLLETDAFRIILTSAYWIDNPTIIIEDAEIKLRSNEPFDDKYVFSADPAYKDHYPQSLFYNYFGIATFYLRYETASKTELQELGQVDILARKATVSQIESMISFILSTDESELLNSRGATRRGADVASNLNDTPNRLLEKLESNIQVLEEQIPYIVNRPITTLDTKLETVRHTPYIDIQEQGISWLAENISVFEQTTDPDSTLLEWYGASLAPQYVQTPVIFESADIYENQIIIGYIDNLLVFLQEILKETEKKSLPRPSLNTYNGYVSFFGSVAEKLLKNIMPERQRILKNQQKLLKFRTLIKQTLELSKTDGTFPRFTPKVRANQVYALVFRSIIDWYKGSSLNWDAKKILIAIDNVPKLFELYTILLVKKWCRLRGQTLESNEGNAWEGQLFDYQARLRYEPTYWMYGHLNHQGSIYNTQHRTIKSSLEDSDSKVRNHKNQKREPDIVLELANDKGVTALLVFDAKYTSKKKAFEEYLPECTIKYVHGLSANGHPRLTHSMIILFPGKLDRSHFFDFHIGPFSLFGNEPQLPILGALGLSLNEGTSEVFTVIDKTIERTIKVLEPST